MIASSWNEKFFLPRNPNLTKWLEIFVRTMLSSPLAYETSHIASFTFWSGESRSKIEHPQGAQFEVTRIFFWLMCTYLKLDQRCLHVSILIVANAAPTDVEIKGGKVGHVSESPSGCAEFAHIGYS